MAIKISVGEQKPKNEKLFPKLMISDTGRIVFMISDRVGFQLNNASTDEPHFYRAWAMEDFTDYNEPITLQNEG